MPKMNRFCLVLLAITLPAKGYEVITGAPTGKTAHLNSFKQPSQICALYDIMLPLKDGYNLTEDIRKLGDIPIIFVSAKSLDEDVVKAFKSGGNDYLKKPFSIVELLVRIESLLTRFGNKKPANEQQQLWYSFGNSKLDTVNQQLKTP